MRIRWRRHFSLFISLWRWFVVFFFVLSVYIVLNLSSERSSADLEQEISRLSVYYVRALVREKKVHHTGDVDVVDLQRTMSVLLHSMLQRLNRIENVVSRNVSDQRIQVAHHRSPRHSQASPYSDTPNMAFNFVTSSKRDHEGEQKLFQQFISFNRLKAAMKNIGTKCNLPTDWAATFPECDGKLEWMRRYHSSDSCYAEYGVDGSNCANVVYLSEVESFCPKSPDVVIRPSVPLRTQLNHLPSILASTPDDIFLRVQANWPSWRAAGQLRASDKKLAKNSKLRVAVVPLGLRDAKDSAMVAMMWADLASALHLLGHDLIWVQSMDQLKRLMHRFPGQADAHSPCQAQVTLFVDLIFTDTRGAEEMRKALGNTFSRIACVLRVLRETGLIPLMESPPSGLQWRQFFTPYPTFDDHSFLGFALERKAVPTSSSRRRFALVLGSRPEDFKGSGPYLAAVAEQFPLHTLLNSAAERSIVARMLSSHVPEFTNHGIANDRLRRLKSLLSSAAVVVGLGKPFDPALALLAMAQGAVFLNPSFDRPRLVLHNTTRLHQDWLVTSQHTYLARFVKAPTVVSVPVDDHASLPVLLKKVAASLQKASPYVPYAFSHIGYLERLTYFLRTQDFCMPTLTPQEPTWPPASAIEFYLSVKGDSCEKTCARKNRVCEPNYFPVINSRVELQERSIECKANYFQPNSAFPALNAAEKTCYFQSDPLRYSCFRSPESTKLLRLCPCRDRHPKQPSLCKNCS